MYWIYTARNWFNWRLIRAHLCTVAVAFGFVSAWRLPREAFQHGGVITAIFFTIAMMIVCVSAALLQLSIGQLSQQDVVGVWRAAPFFTGIGYLRLLASFLYAICTIIYVALCVTYFFYTISNSVLFWECTGSSAILDENVTYEYTYNTSTCLNATLLAPVGEQPEYYVSKAFIIIVLWLLFPLVFYSPVKLMKRVFYAFGPIVLLLGIIIVICIGEAKDLSTFTSDNDWASLGKPYLWHGAITQALLSSQVASGYLIASGDTIYANTDVEWTTLTFIGINIVSSWTGLLFWYSISGDGDKDTSNVAVLAETLILSIDKKLSIVWPLLIFAMLFFSGAITMLTLLYPIFERIRRVTCVKWRHAAIASCVVAAGVSMFVLALGQPAIFLVEDVMVPLLITVATALEIAVFVFVYGWKVLLEDVEFLIERKLRRFWVVGWCAAPGIITPLTVWWTVAWFVREADWRQPPWVAGGLVATIALALGALVVFAAISVAKQVQYDVISKLKCSFQPSRHWGPRDPITHYYWLTRREESTRNLPRSRYRRRKLGQLSGNSSFFNASNVSVDIDKVVDKRRANSDDLLFFQRKQKIAEVQMNSNRRRSKSLDWDIMSKIKLKNKGYVEHKNVDIKMTSISPFAV